MHYVIIFFVMVFSLMTWSSEAERDTTISIGEYWSEVAERPTVDISFEEGMEKQDSLWNEIQAIELLDENYFILDKRHYEYRTIEMLEYGKPGYFEK